MEEAFTLKPEKEHRPRNTIQAARMSASILTEVKFCWVFMMCLVLLYPVEHVQYQKEKKKKRIVLRCYRKPYLTQFIIRRTFITELLKSGMEYGT